MTSQFTVSVLGHGCHFLSITRMTISAEQQYLQLCSRILEEGTWVMNERTGKRCLTVIDANFTYDVSRDAFPVLTTRHVPWRSAIAEMLGYLRGYDNAHQFAEIGCRTWFANANESPEWLANPFRRGDGDIGRCYGAILRDYRNPEGESIDQLAILIDKLNKRIDDRRLMITFHSPGELDRAALAACMHTHHFNIVGDSLFLTSIQRSVDVPLGLAYNKIQVYFLLKIIAQITNLKPKYAYHKLQCCHVYEDQLDLLKMQLARKPYAPPKLTVSEDIKTLEDLETWVEPLNKEQFQLDGYVYHPRIKYPFSA